MGGEIGVHSTPGHGQHVLVGAARRRRAERPARARRARVAVRPAAGDVADPVRRRRPRQPRLITGPLSLRDDCVVITATDGQAGVDMARPPGAARHPDGQQHARHERPRGAPPRADPAPPASPIIALSASRPSSTQPVDTGRFPATSSSRSSCVRPWTPSTRRWRRAAPPERRRHASDTGTSIARPSARPSFGHRLQSPPKDLVVARPEGLYCPAGDFYIDPWRPVARAVITHAHGDHARIGHGHYLAAAPARRRAARAPGRHRAADAAPTASASTHHGVTRVAASGRPRARLGAGAARARRPGLGRLGRLQGRARPDLRAVRAGALPRASSPNRPSACRSTAGSRTHEVFADIDAWWRAQRRGGPRERAVRLRLRQGAAHPGRRRRRRSGPIVCTARSSR